MASSDGGSVLAPAGGAQERQQQSAAGSSANGGGGSTTTMPPPPNATPAQELQHSAASAPGATDEADAQRLLRLINLAEVLREQLEALPVLAENLPAELTDQQLLGMSEADVRVHYSQPHQPQQDHHQASKQASSLEQLRQRFPPQEHTPEFRAFFPSAAPTSSSSGGKAGVVICFHAAGTAEDMWTSEGTGSRRVPSPLLEACAQHGWRLLAPQLPGRGQRMRELPLESLQAVARALLPLIAHAVLAAGGRYVVVAHSMGSWAAYELLLLMQQEGFGGPAAACLGAMPWPHIPDEQRPWRQQHLLNDEEFKDECRAWGINDAVFGMWDLYGPLLRADFRLFDQYRCSSGGPDDGPPVLGPRCLLRLFWGARDTRISRGMLEGWRRYTGRAELAAGELVCVQGGHLWPVTDPAAKAAWLAEVAHVLRAALPTEPAAEG